MTWIDSLARSHHCHPEQRQRTAARFPPHRLGPPLGELHHTPPPPLFLPTGVRPRRLADPISHPWCTHSPRWVQRAQAQLLVLLMLIRIMCSRRHPEPWEPCLPRRLQLRLVQDVLGAHRARPARDPRPIQFGRMHLVELLHTSVVLCFVDRERGVMC